MASFLVSSSPLPAFRPTRFLPPPLFPNLTLSLTLTSPKPRSLTVTSAITDSNSPKPLAANDDAADLLQDLTASLQLPPDYLAGLPEDLRLDLNDAAFDLASGPVLDECGQELGEVLLNLSRAWEKADTSTSNIIASQIPLLQSSLTDNVNSAFGKRLVSAGRRFEAMGQYGQGELQKIGKAMIKIGKFLSASPVIKTDETPKKESRMFKFGELQVELTPEKANIGAVIAVAFAILSWQLSQGIQSIPESSLQYANENALLLAKSLRGALLVSCYASTILSACSSVGLVLLGRQLSSGSESKNL